MTNEEQITQLKQQFDKLQKQVDNLNNQNNKYQAIKQFDNLRITSRLTIKFVQSNTANEPSPVLNEIFLWNNTQTSKYYLKANFNGINKKVELT